MPTQQQSHTVRVTRKAKFSAAHFYHLPELSPEENLALFKGCANRNGHGHNYVVEASVEGPTDPKTGMVVNLKDIKDILREEVVTRMDHKNLNHDVPYFKDRIPTLENIAIYIWERVAPRVEAISLRLTWLKVIENDELYVEYDGEPEAA